MYEFYPDWASRQADEWSRHAGASHDPDDPRSHEAVQHALDLRDRHGERPDDN